MPSRRYYVIEHQGVAVEVTTSWARAVALKEQYSSKRGEAVIVEAEALQQELPLEDNDGHGCSPGCFCGR